MRRRARGANRLFYTDIEMVENFRKFNAGPDPFGRTWNVEFRWLQTAISIRHADTVDVKFEVATEGEPNQRK